MIQEILIPIVLKIQRAIRFWIYRRKYLPYLNIKRQQEKTRRIQRKIIFDMNKKYIPNIPDESYKLHKTIGYQLNLQYMPQYFIELDQQASKQLNEDDVKSIIKSRNICENKLEAASDVFRNEIIYDIRRVRIENLIT